MKRKVGGNCERGRGICEERNRDREGVEREGESEEERERRKMSTWGQFHQHYTRSFYTHRAQKCKNDSQVMSHFELLGSAIKKLRKQC